MSEPKPGTPPAAPGSGAAPPPARLIGGVALKRITTPVLVSAVANLIAGYLWLTSCFGIVLTAPMLVLCIFEFIYFATAVQMTSTQIVNRGRALGICEIVVGVFNLVSLVCGVLVLITLGKVGPETGAARDPRGFDAG